MNLNKFLIFMIAFFSFCCGPVVPDIKYAKSPIELGRDSTVAFVIVMPSGEVSPYCAGVWINQDTMLTALHCAKVPGEAEQINKLDDKLKPFADMLIEPIIDPTNAEMFYIMENESNGLGLNPKTLHKSKVIAVDLTHDLALIQSVGMDMPYHDWLRISNTIPTVGDKVYLVGHQGGLYFTVMDGMISALRDSFPMDPDDEVIINGPFIQIFSSIYSGSSGGPVISERGELIGIVSFITLRTPNQGFAISPISIRRFIFDTYEKHILN